MLQLGPFEDMPWVARLLPEFVWIAFLIREYDIKRSAELMIILSRAALLACKTTRPWFGAMSSFRLLGLDQQLELRNAMEKARVLDELTDPLTPLFAAYPECPLAAILRPQAHSAEQPAPSFVMSITEIVEEMMDKRGRLATFAQVHAIYVAFDSELLKVVAGLALSRFPAVQNYPNSEESKEVAASARGAAAMLTAQCVADEVWPRYFWNRGMVISPCSFAVQEHE